MTLPVTGVGIGRVQMSPAWKATLSNATWHVWGAIATEMEEIAKRYVPVRSGDLQRSIQGKARRVGYQPMAELTAGEPYALFVEFGTGRRGRGTAGSDVPSGYTHGRQEGMEAQPFLRPALEDVMRRWFKVTG